MDITHPDDDGLSDEHWVDERLDDLRCDNQHLDIDELVLALIYYFVAVDGKSRIHCPTYWTPPPKSEYKNEKKNVCVFNCSQQIKLHVT